VRRRLRLEWLLATVGVGALLVVLVVNWGDVRSGLEESPWRFAIATGSSTIGLLSVSFSWAMLHEGARRAEAMNQYLLIQPAKHIPGGIAQPVGVVTASSRMGNVAESTTAFVRFSLFLVAAGLLLGGLFCFTPGNQLWGVLSLVGSAIVLAIALSSRWRRLLERGLARLLKRLRMSPVEPSTRGHDERRSGLLAFLFAVLGISGLALGFAALASAVGDTSDWAALTAAFGIAWAIGFAALPFPAGLGVREAVLIGVLAGTMPAGVVVAVSVVQRVAQVLAEGISALLGFVLERRRRRSVGLDIASSES
jgi:uncharacterized membrane protein YbhN (UPF0104 family)